MKVQLNFLKLVYPPVSNQEAEWLKDDPEVREEIQGSNLYMIGQRVEGKFDIPPESVEEMNNSGVLPFRYFAGSASSNATLNFNKLLEYHDIDHEQYEIKIELGDKLIRI